MKPNLFHCALSQVSDKTRKRVREWCDKKDNMEKREIKFRGLEANGKWHYGQVIETFHFTYVVNLHNMPAASIPAGYFREVDPETVGQYTGLRDRNGVEIYEGDILCDEKQVSDHSYLFRVEYVDGWFVGQPAMSNPYPGYLQFNDFLNYSVLGNIHEDQELITKTKKNAHNS